MDNVSQTQMDPDIRKRLEREWQRVWGCRDMATPACPNCGGHTVLRGYYPRGPLVVDCMGDCQYSYVIERESPDVISGRW